MKKSDNTEYVIAGSTEASIFLEMIDRRINEFSNEVSQYNPEPQILGDLKEWLEFTKSEIKNTFLNWYQNNIEGKQIPKNLVIPLPKEDPAISKFKSKFAGKQCEVCGDKRVMNIAHIIPRLVGGPNEEWNLMRLCANHHYLFDNVRLTQDEWNSIDWASKDQRARDFAFTHQLNGQRLFWQDTK